MTFQDIFINKIRQLPEDILQEVYFLDVVTSKGRLQWNLYLADKYRGYEMVIPDPRFLEFKINNWYIKREKDDELL